MNPASEFLQKLTTKQVGLAMTMASEMEAYGITTSDLLAACRAYFADIEKTVSTGLFPPAPLPSKNCPLCGGQMIAKSVNVSRCTQIGGSWRSILLCEKTTCRHSELSEHPVSYWRLR